MLLSAFFVVYLCCFSAFETSDGRTHVRNDERESAWNMHRFFNAPKRSFGPRRQMKAGSRQVKHSIRADEFGLWQEMPDEKRMCNFCCVSDSRARLWMFCCLCMSLQTFLLLCDCFGFSPSGSSSPRERIFRFEKRRK